MAEFWTEKLVKPALLSAAMLSLSACAYGGAYGDGYVNGAGYACDPYAPFDDYYACDNGYGYANIGFGGGWYDSFYYPGYGIYIFDRRGYRHAMKRHHRRHWAKKRAEYGWRKGERRAKRIEGRRNLNPEQRAERRDRRAERRRNLTPEQRAERRELRAERRRDLTPAQRAERRDRRAQRIERRRNLTPEQRADRRAERKQRRANNGNRAPATRAGRAALRDGNLRGQRGSEARQVRRANRQAGAARSERRARPASTQQRSQQPRRAVRPNAQQRSAPTVRKAPRPAPKARPARRSSHRETSRSNVHID